MSDLFWKRWTKEYFPQLQECQKWTGAKRNIVVGDIMLIVDETAHLRTCGLWEELSKPFQTAEIKTKISTLDRPITKICLLQEVED